jgi:hypothetical protein
MDTKDGVTSDSEDSSLTREQAELLSRLEGLFRELPLSRQHAMIRKLRADDPDGGELPRVEDLPSDGSNRAGSLTPSE